MVGFVESSDKKDHIRRFCGLYRFVHQLLGRAVVSQVLAGGNTIILAAYIAYISAHITHFGPILLCSFENALQGRDLIFRF